MGKEKNTEIIKKSKEIQTGNIIIADIRKIIDETRANVAVTANAGMTMLFGGLAEGYMKRFFKISELNMELRLCRHCRHN